MPWETTTLNDGNKIPGIAYGTGTQAKGRPEIDIIKQAISLGFRLIDTAQSYKNEAEVGQAIRESRVARKDLFISTKYSWPQTDIHTTIKTSLELLGVDYVNLYLLHNPPAAVRDIPRIWSYYEEFQRKGWTKSIGVSNFSVPQLKVLLASAKVKPAVNQIGLNPYTYSRKAPIIDFCKANGIAIEAYNTLVPLTRMAGGPLDKPLLEIAGKRGVTPEQILLAWVRAKGVAVAVTTTRKRERLENYLAAGDIKLTESEITALDAAGGRRVFDLLAE